MSVATAHCVLSASPERPTRLEHEFHFKPHSQPFLFVCRTVVAPPLLRNCGGKKGSALPCRLQIRVEYERHVAGTLKRRLSCFFGRQPTGLNPGIGLGLAAPTFAATGRHRSAKAHVPHRILVRALYAVHSAKVGGAALSTA